MNKMNSIANVCLNKFNICRTTPRPRSLLNSLLRNPDAQIYLGDIRVKPMFTKETQFWTDANTGAIICEELDAELRKLGGPMQTGITGQPSKRNSKETNAPVGYLSMASNAVSGTENVIHVFRNVRRRDDIDNNDAVVSSQSMKSTVDSSQYPLKNAAGQAVSPGLLGANPAPGNLGLNATSTLGPSKQLPLSGTQFFPDAGSTTKIENRPTNQSSQFPVLTSALTSTVSGSYFFIPNYIAQFV